MMYRIVTIFLMICLWSSPGLHAQNDREKLAALRVSFINKQVELSSREAEKFWPVYNEYNDKLRAIRESQRNAYKKVSGAITEKQAEEIYLLEQRLMQAENAVHSLYGEKIRELIGVRKFVLLRKAEDEFKSVIIKSLKERNE